MSTSLRTLGEIKTEFLIRYQGSTTSAFVNDTVLNNWLDQAHQKASAFKKWPMTEGRVSTTFASLITNEDGWLTGQYPEGWKSDSIRLLTVGGKRLQKTNFYQFQKFIEDNTGDDARYYTDFGRQYFINPSIDLSGTVTAWGQYTPALDTTDSSATTIFSDADIEGNEAIIYYMLSFAHDREKKTKASVDDVARAELILEKIWERYGSEQFAYQATDTEGMWGRFDAINGYRDDDLFKRDQF